MPFVKAQGFEVQTGVYGMETAFRGEWGHGPVTIAICAEYDALPEIGHACGHNLIATSGVGAAVGLIKAIEPVRRARRHPRHAGRGDASAAK